MNGMQVSWELFHKENYCLDSGIDQVDDKSEQKKHLKTSMSIPTKKNLIPNNFILKNYSRP